MMPSKSKTLAALPLLLIGVLALALVKQQHDISALRPTTPRRALLADGDGACVTAAQFAEHAQAVNASLAELRRGREAADARAEALEARVAELTRPDTPRRRAQGAAPEPEPEPDIGENVKIIKPQTVYCGGPGGTTNDGSFDYSQCTDRAFAACHAAACSGHTGGGHRRAQAGGGGYGGDVSCADVTRRSAEVTARCCDEAGEDCSGGHPHTCNAGCAAIFLPFWTDCRSALGKDSSAFEPVVALCNQAAPPAAAASLAEQLNVQCTDGTAAADCVPACSEQLHGFLMLLNIGGNDLKLSCELRHSFYSWVGAAVRNHA